MCIGDIDHHSYNFKYLYTNTKNIIFYYYNVWYSIWWQICDSCKYGRSALKSVSDDDGK